MSTKNIVILLAIISYAFNCTCMLENLDAQAFVMPNNQQLIELIKENNLGSLLTKTSIIKRTASKKLTGSDLASILYITQWELAHTKTEKRHTIQHCLETMFLKLTSTSFLSECRYFQRINTLKTHNINTTLKPRTISSLFHPSIFATQELRSTLYTHSPEDLEKLFDTYFFNQIQTTYPSSIPQETINDLKKMLLKKLTKGVSLLELEIFIQQACSLCAVIINEALNLSLAIVAPTILFFLDTTLSEILQPITFTKLLAFRCNYYYKMLLLGYHEHCHHYENDDDNLDDCGDLEEM